WCWHEACGCVFTVDAELESVATWGGVFLDAQLLAFSDAELLAHQVQAGGFFSDWVLNLQTSVDLEEGDEAIGADQVFHGAGTVVACLAADTLCGLVDGGALLIGQEWGRSFFDELLETTLQGAVAGTSNNDVAMLIGKYLSLDVACLVQVALNKALAAAEGTNCLTRCGLEKLCNLRLFISNLHAAATAAESCLNSDRQTELFCESLYLSSICHWVLGSWGHRCFCALSNVAGSDLVTQICDGLWRWADPNQACVDYSLRKFCIFSQETVSRMDGI